MKKCIHILLRCMELHVKQAGLEMVMLRRSLGLQSSRTLESPIHFSLPRETGHIVQDDTSMKSDVPCL
jgi:hypothetical protein